MTYLQITLFIAEGNRAKAAKVYEQYKEPFLRTIQGARSKELLVRQEDVQVLHGFDSQECAKAYLQSALFTQDVVNALSPLFEKEPNIAIYECVAK